MDEIGRQLPWLCDHEAVGDNSLQLAAQNRPQALLLQDPTKTTQPLIDVSIMLIVLILPFLVVCLP